MKSAEERGETVNTYAVLDNLARRDPQGFLESRSKLRRRWSRVVTGDLGFRAVRAMAQPRRGRGWGAKSETPYKRMMEQRLAEAVHRLKDPSTIDAKPAREPLIAVARGVSCAAHADRNSIV